MFRVPPHPGAWKGMLAAEGWLLAMERLKADPGVFAGELPAIAEGITALARARADGLQWPS